MKLKIFSCGLLLAGLVTSSAFALTTPPPEFRGSRAYRNSSAAGAHSNSTNINSNTGRERFLTTYTGTDQTNGVSFTTQTTTFGVTGIAQDIIPGDSTNINLVVTTDIPIRGLTISLIMSSADFGPQPGKYHRLSVGKTGGTLDIASVPIVELGDTDSTILIVPNAASANVPLTFVASASGSIASDVQVAAAANFLVSPPIVTATYTVPPISLSNMMNFTNTNTAGTWSVKFENTTRSISTFRGFQVTVTGDTFPGPVTINGRRFDPTPRSAATYRDKTGQVPLTRAQTEN